MLISYEPNSDILTITFQAAPAAQTQVQGTVTLSLDASGAPVSVSIPEASSILFESGGQVNVMLPERTVQTVVEVREPR